MQLRTAKTAIVPIIFDPSHTAPGEAELQDASLRAHIVSQFQIRRT